jgi:flagellar FliL protein
MNMSDDDPDSAEAPQKKSKMPLILGLVLALVGGGGGFYTTWSGMILSDESHAAEADKKALAELPDVAFVPIDPMIVSLPSPATSKHLRFRAELEVPTVFRPDVEKLLPRVVDVLNSYLRALEISDLEDAAALTRLRAQMLRRVQVVVGQERVNDLLIMEFVFN